MGLIEWIGKRVKRKEKKKQKSERTKTVTKSESLGLEGEKVYSPSIEHPLLTIQDRIARLEEIYRSLNEKIEHKVATREDVEKVRVIVENNSIKEDAILGRVKDLKGELARLEEKKRELTRKVDVSTEELTQNLRELKSVEESIDLLETDKKVLDALKERDSSTIELSESLGYTRQYLWGRLKHLQTAGLVESKKVGRQTKYSVTDNNATEEPENQPKNV
jgi:uncharacterized membrane protein